MKAPFPHMGIRDIELFASFALSDEAKRFRKWEFDVKVAIGRCPPAVVDPAMRKMAFDLTRLRIDAVGWEGNWPTLFEVKPDAHLSAFGQILAYCLFWQRERGTTCRRAIITDECNDDMRFLYNAHGIDLFCVRPATISQIADAVDLLQPRTPTQRLHRPSV